MNNYYKFFPSKPFVGNLCSQQALWTIRALQFSRKSCSEDLNLPGLPVSYTALLFWSKYLPVNSVLACSLNPSNYSYSDSKNLSAFNLVPSHRQELLSIALQHKTILAIARCQFVGSNRAQESWGLSLLCAYIFMANE